MFIETKCDFCKNHITRFIQKHVKMHFCDNGCKADWQRTQHPVSDAWLRKKYIDERLDAVQIALIVSRDPKSVWNWLRGAGIPTRPRGGATAPKSFRKGMANGWTGKHHSDATRKRMSAHAKATGRVPYDPAVGSYMKGRSGVNTPNWKGGITAERQAFYSTKEWKAACVAVWHRADAKCERCGLDHRAVDNRKKNGFHIHHIASFAVEMLRAVPSNLALLCRSCHFFVHSKKNVKNEFIIKE